MREFICYFDRLGLRLYRWFLLLRALPTVFAMWRRDRRIALWRESQRIERLRYPERFIAK